MFDLRGEALRWRGEIRRSPARGFAGARIDLIPHQLFIASEVSGRLTPRVLLADEVGLGKTIEAGIVLCQYWAERKRQLFTLQWKVT
jgi:ATP-dependent helicase HepA